MKQQHSLCGPKHGNSCVVAVAVSLLTVLVMWCIAIGAFSTVTWHWVIWQRGEASAVRAIAMIPEGPTAGTYLAGLNNLRPIRVNRVFLDLYERAIPNDSEYQLALGSSPLLGPLHFGTVYDQVSGEQLSTLHTVMMNGLEGWAALGLVGMAAAGVRATRHYRGGFVERRLLLSMVGLSAARSVTMAAILAPGIAVALWFVYYDIQPGTPSVLGRFWPSTGEYLALYGVMACVVAWLAAGSQWRAAGFCLRVRGFPNCMNCGYPLGADGGVCPECGPAPFATPPETVAYRVVVRIGVYFLIAIIAASYLSRILS